MLGLGHYKLQFSFAVRVPIRHFHSGAPRKTRRQKETELAPSLSGALNVSLMWPQQWCFILVATVDSRFQKDLHYAHWEVLELVWQCAPQRSEAQLLRYRYQDWLSNVPFRGLSPNSTKLLLWCLGSANPVSPFPCSPRDGSSFLKHSLVFFMLCPAFWGY